ncbi:DUF4974 domain-containing protein [Maribellus comscasis]|uniref:DUF4974 domain-containing protein n=1 Tax=Maribellus comscasis TaxID=2681766 RepID=A0A6I6K1A1_9BACT|nr:FecR domain-containing protein [Maribellus comscasis]QGY45213.1 DUF4974 domain-containing protein [Maribellus comscasis]
MEKEPKRPDKKQLSVLKSKLLDKYFNNTCSPDELDLLFSWLLDNSDQAEKQRILEVQWKKAVSIANKETRPQMQQRLDKIHHKINLANTNYTTEQSKNKKVRYINWQKIVYRAAAVILLPVLTLFIYINYFQESANLISLNHKAVINEIVSPVGSRTSLELADGTKVWLNHGSKLLYPQNFEGKNRTVTLVGEGYFDVAHNPKKPFIVKTDRINVTALGTRFNVKAYSDDKTVSATLKSGKIEVKSSKNKITMKPNQHLKLGLNNEKFKVQNVDPEKYISWKDGKLIFEDDNIENIVKRLSRWYDVDIEIIDPEIKDLTYTATFIDEPLFQILEMLAVVTPIKYEIPRRNKLPDGTYSKRIIKIYAKN